jgi:hypothetical protein
MWLVDLEDVEPRADVRPTLGEGVEARPQNYVLRHAMGSLLENQILHEPSSGHDAGPEPSGASWVHDRGQITDLWDIPADREAYDRFFDDL